MYLISNTPLHIAVLSTCEDIVFINLQPLSAIITLSMNPYIVINYLFGLYEISTILQYSAFYFILFINTLSLKNLKFWFLVSDSIHRVGNEVLVLDFNVQKL